MRTISRNWRRTTAAGLALAAGLTLAGCGGDDGGSDAAPTGRSGETASEAPSPSPTPDVIIDRLPEPPAGTVRIDGNTDAFTQSLGDAYVASDQSRLVRAGGGDSRGFQRLCVGEVDVVSSSRPITPEEWAQCQALGLDVVQYQMGADAIVLAIQNESVDVGSDCLSTTQANRIFRAGSTINNWSQVGENFDDVRLDTGGPEIGSAQTQFFGTAVLGAEQPSQANFRSDYRSFRNDDGTRVFVAGSLRDRRLAELLVPLAPRREVQRAQFLLRYKELKDARKEVRVALFERNKGIRDNRPVRIKRQDEARLQRAYDARAVAINRYNAALARYRPVNDEFLRLSRSQKRLDNTRGNVGIFQFSYYQVYEQYLRPFEIEIAEDGNEEQNCIFASPQTILSGEYPLSRQLLLTTTTRALRRPEVVSYLRTALLNSQDAAARSGVVALPDKDVNRQLIYLRDGTTPVIESVDGGPVIVQPDEQPTEAVVDDVPDDQVEVPAR